MNPLPHGNDLNDIVILDSLIAVAVGQYGTIQKTVDGGNEWNIVLEKRDLYLKSVDFIDNQTGFVAGSYGLPNYNSTSVILKTTDGGKTWNMTDLKVDQSLFFIKFPEDSDIGYAVGINSIFKTEDRGQTWHLMRYFNISVGWNYVSIPDKDSIFLVEFAGNSALKSTDGGLTWNWQYFYLSEYFWIQSIEFLDAHTGFISGRDNLRSSAAIIKYEEGGFVDWVYEDENARVINNLFFTNDSVGYAKKSDKLLQTTDRGETWNVIFDEGSLLLGINSIEIRDDSGFAVGTNGLLLETTDTGNNWDLNGVNDLISGSLKNIFFFDKDYGWAGCSDGIYETVNGGNNWRRLNSNVGTGELFVIDSQVAFCMDLYVHKTTDGWGSSQKLTGYNIGIEQCMYFLDENTGIIGGRETAGTSGLAKIVKTADGGATWTEQIFSAGDVVAIQMLNYNIGYAVIENFPPSYIYKTNDGGGSWNLIETIDYTATAMQFVDENTGYIVAYNQLFKTTDGGVSWTHSIIRTPNWNYYFGGYSINFLNENTGYICGKWGRIIYTDDGGTTWHEQDSGTDADLNNIFILDSENIWINGASSSLLYMNNEGSNVELSNNLITDYFLYQNYPNPFNSTTKISYSLKEGNNVEISVFNNKGEQVAELLKGYKRAGTYNIEFDCSSLTTGVYLYKMIIENKTASSKKMVFIK